MPLLRMLLPSACAVLVIAGPARAGEADGFCGDGIVQPDLGEECDDANFADHDGCNNRCELPVCGDGVLDGDEVCDDGNDNTTDDCPACALARCGDGFVHVDTEECDDGNDDELDACATTCRFAGCGDGVLQVATEACDDGNDDDNDSCLTSCNVNICGDGLLNRDDEQCDDGNDNDDDECSSDCLRQFDLVGCSAQRRGPGPALLVLVAILAIVIRRVRLHGAVDRLQ